MRVSTSQIYALGVDGIARAQADLIYTQQQIKQASGSGLTAYVVSLQAPARMPANPC